MGLIEEIAALEKEAMEEHGGVEGSEGSSGASFLENATDNSFGKALAKHAKDEELVNNALKNGGQIFSKARVGERVGLTVENLRRNNGSHEVLISKLNGSWEGSIASDRSGPGVNVPRGWGRKGKGGKEWLGRINNTSGRGRSTGDSPKLAKDRDSIATKENQALPADAEVDWVSTAVDVPLPSIENGSSLGESISRGSTPKSTNRRNVPLERIQQWDMDDEDFTAGSLQISNSPRIKVRNSTLDRIRDREIESVERRAVTTSRLVEIREKTSKEQLRRRSPSVPLDESQAVKGETTDQSERSFSAPSRNQTIPEDEGHPIPNTPVVIHKGPKHNSDKASEATRSSRGQAEPSKRPSPERQDSLSLLRQLARATSSSPSPSPAKDLGEEKKQPISEKEPQGPLPTNHQSEQDNLPAKQKEAAEVNIPQERDTFLGIKLQEETEKTPRPPPQIRDLKTPHVMGAWIDTPLPTGNRGPPLPTPADMEDVNDLTFGINEELSHLGIPGLKGGSSDDPPRASTNDTGNRGPKETKSKTPISALATLLDDARKGLQGDVKTEKEDDEDSQLDEDTMQSLQDLIADETDFSDFLKLIEDKPSLADPEGRPLTSTERERQMETLALDRMNKRLKALGLSIHDAKRGISKLAQQVCNEGGEFHDFIWPCEKCGCRGRSSMDTWRGGDHGLHISIPIPRLWTWRKGERLKLTWLGLFTLLAWAWVITELTVW